MFPFPPWIDTFLDGTCTLNTNFKLFSNYYYACSKMRPLSFKFQTDQIVDNLRFQNKQFDK